MTTSRCHLACDGGIHLHSKDFAVGLVSFEAQSLQPLRGCEKTNALAKSLGSGMLGEKKIGRWVKKCEQCGDSHFPFFYGMLMYIMGKEADKAEDLGVSYFETNPYL